MTTHLISKVWFGFRCSQCYWSCFFRMSRLYQLHLPKVTQFQLTFKNYEILTKRNAYTLVSCNHANTVSILVTYSHEFQYHSHSDKLLRLCLGTLYLLVANSDYGFSKKKDRDMYWYLAIVKIETSVLTHVLHAIITQLSFLSFN